MINRLILTPSFYVLSTWFVTLLAYIAEPIILLPLSFNAILIILYVMAVSFVSAVLFSKSYAIAMKYNKPEFQVFPTLFAFVMFSVLGVAGLKAYFDYATDAVGGWGNYLYLVQYNPLAIRALEVSELGGAIQLSYLSWIAIGIGVHLIRKHNVHWAIKLFVLLLVFTEFFLNMAFVDRTRPVWLIVVVGISFIFTLKDSIRGMKVFLFAGPILVIAIFISFSIVTNKVTAGGTTDTIIQYFLGGFAYFNFILDNIAGFEYEPVRIFYPISKVLSALGVIGEVPSQVLDFYQVPFATNVGTFAEPFFRDGGFAFLIVGIPIVLFSIDWLGLIAVKSRSILGVFLYSNLIFTNLIAFFSPKFVSTPIYLFIIVFFLSRIQRTGNSNRRLERRSPQFGRQSSRPDFKKRSN